MKRRKKGWIIYLAAFITTLAFGTLGAIVIRPGSGNAVLIAGCCCAIPPLMMLLSFILTKRFEKKFKSASAAELQAFILSHREAAEKTAQEKLRLLCRLIGLMDAATVLVGLCGAAVAFFYGMTPNTYAIAALLGFWFLFCAFGRIRFKVRGRDPEDKCFVSEADYPELYAVIRRAQRAMGDHSPINVYLTTDHNAGIGIYDDCCVIFISVFLLNICSEDEIYTLLLHELEHTGSVSRERRRVISFVRWCENGGAQHFFSWADELMFGYLQQRFGFEYQLYTYAATLSDEAAADRAMAEHSSPELAASLLLKLKYCDLFGWESWGTDYCPVYSHPEPYESGLEDLLSEFLEAMNDHRELWDELSRREIPSRSASHPILRQRLEALGVSEYRTLPFGGSEAYTAECKKALCCMEKLSADDAREGYAEARQTAYLDHAERIEKWEAEGRPLDPEAYSDTVFSLCELGRRSEAVMLCDRAIAELPESAAYYAMDVKGGYLLRHFDDAGIELLYRAMHGNRNFTGSIDLIGEYCCITGNQAELDRYREEAVALQQVQMDIYSEVGVLRKGDKLSASVLPEDERSAALDRIRDAGGEDLVRVYLIDKEITPEFITSVFIVALKDGTDAKRRQEVLHSVFLYLDTCSDRQYSLFEYSEVKGIPERVEGSLVYEAKN